MLQNKRFQSNETQEIVTISGDNGVFYNLSNGANIKKDIFFQKYSEMVDPSSFFQQQSAAGLSSLAEQMRNVDSSKAMDGDLGGPQVKYRQEAVSEQLQAPPEYREMLMRKFQQEQQNKDLSQYRVFENDDDAAADFEKRQKQQQVTQFQQRQRPPDPYNQPPQQPQQPVNENYEQPVQPMQQPIAQPSYLSPEEESFRFFKGFKRAYPIKLTVDFDERIAEPNFIRMMVTNMEGDIIKFYTKEIMNRIYNDPGFLENKIYDKLRTLVFVEEQRVEKKPRAPKPQAKKSTHPKKRNIPTVPKEDRDQFRPVVMSRDLPL
jgi:hypothetical protein